MSRANVITEILNTFLRLAAFPSDTTGAENKRVETGRLIRLMDGTPKTRNAYREQKELGVVVFEPIQKP
jgi:hypothetical protein